uniref:ESF1, nucleolar pre-rRNA processing protein, homolog (S. cerevisiae) n=1 Tax=Sparus aurata TaxID=8175 RepID=A0A671VQ75_SPAAU
MSSKKNKDGDERFLRVQKDPRFWEMPERERKVKIDKRFQSMFHDKRFKVKYTVDKRGRPINHTSTEDLKRFYNISDSEDEEDEDDVKSKKVAEGKKKKKVKEKLVKADGAVKKEKPVVTDGSEEDDEEEDDGDEESDEASGSDEEESGLDSEEDSDSGPDLARGKGNIESSSDEDDDDDVDAILRKEEEEIEHDWGELCKDAPRSDEVTARLAVCNMDWDRMKAKDLLALLNSFTPNGGAVLSVKIYPSEFGKERITAEQTQGPLELRALPDDSEDDTEEEKVYREKMRDYQFKRLKYFYAVVECDSVNTAAKIYEECDGYEYESSCSVLDLRFIPDDEKFDEEPKDVATDVNLSAYTPKLFTSSATTTSKVQLTWDETDHERVTALNRNFNKNELLHMDFNAYLASSSEEEDDEEGGFEFGEEENDDDGKQKKKKSEEQILKYRELLKGIQEKEKKLQEDKAMEMEISWVPGLKETTEQLVKKKLEGKDQLTPWEDFLERKKERKKQKKSQRNQGEEEEELSEEDLPSDVDLSDPFFAEERKRSWRNKRSESNPDTYKPPNIRSESSFMLSVCLCSQAEMALLMEDDGEDAKQKHFNYDKIVEQQNLSKKKRKKLLKKGEEPLEGDDFQVDVKDPRFQAMFTSHLFNLDPSHPSYKKTKATQSILTEKQRRRGEEEQRRAEGTAAGKQEAAGTKRENDSDAPTVETASKKSMDPNLSLLIKSIKSKTEQFQARKKQKLK